MPVRGPSRPAVVFLALAALNLALHVPLFWPGETSFRGSIEPGYAAMARFFADHPNPWGWNPEQYFGLPAQFTYLPLVPYLTAAVAAVTPAAAMPDVYRAVVALFAVLGTPAAFWLAWRAWGSAGWALGFGLAATFLSPAYVFPQVAPDIGGAYLPWRLQVLVKFGEGPHNVGLFFLPLALIAADRAARRRRYADVWLAAVAMAAAALSSWVAALALAICCLLLMLAMRGDGFSCRHVLGSAALAYGLACFWLTPTFVSTTLLNWPVDSLNYRFRAGQMLLVVGAFAGLAALHAAFRRWLADQRWLQFFTLAAWFFGYAVAWKYGRGLEVLPEPHRYAPEAEMFLLLAATGAARRAFARPERSVRAVAAVCVAAALLAGARQVKAMLLQGFAIRRPLDRESLPEYRLARFLEERKPAGRIFAFGGLRFGLNSWTGLPQVGGVFESGLRNRAALDFYYLVKTNESGAACVQALRAAGVEYVVVHGPESKEFYREAAAPDKFEGLLEKVLDEGGDRVYRVPFDSYAHAVDAGALAGWPYLGGREPGESSLPARWDGPSRLRIEGPAPAGGALLVRVTHDEGWAATQGGRPVAVERDPMGFLLLRPASEEPIELAYRAPAEPRAFAALSALAWIGSLAGFARRPRRGSASIENEA